MGFTTVSAGCMPVGFTTVSAGCLPVVSGVNQTSIWESNPTNDSRHWCLPNFDKGIEPNQRLRGLRVGVSVLAPVVPCVGGLHASGESHGLSGVRASGGSHGLRADLFLVLRVGNKKQTLGVGVSMLAPGVAGWRGDFPGTPRRWTSRGFPRVQSCNPPFRNWEE